MWPGAKMSHEKYLTKIDQWGIQHSWKRPLFKGKIELFFYILTWLQIMKNNKNISKKITLRKQKQVLNAAFILLHYENVEYFE